MAHPTTYRVEVVSCPREPSLFRWRILQDGIPLDLPGFSYVTAWAASEAGNTALYWHRVLHGSRMERAPAGAPAAHDAA